MKNSFKVKIVHFMFNLPIFPVQTSGSNPNLGWYKRARRRRPIFQRVWKSITNLVSQSHVESILFVIKKIDWQSLKTRIFYWFLFVLTSTSNWQVIMCSILASTWNIFIFCWFLCDDYLTFNGHFSFTWDIIVRLAEFPTKTPK